MTAAERDDREVTLAAELAGAGLGAGRPVALVTVPDGVALHWRAADGRTDAGPAEVREIAGDPSVLLRELAELDVRWVWWSARDAGVVAAGVRPRACWDLAAVSRLVHGHGREDPAAVWAATHDLSPPPLPRGEPDLFAVAGGRLDDDGQLSESWQRGGWAETLQTAAQWAALAWDVYADQRRRLDSLADPRAAPRQPPLALLTAWAESAAALLAVELEADGLPVDVAAVGDVLRGVIGERPIDEHHAAAQRRERDAVVLLQFPNEAVSGAAPPDLRNPQQVRELLVRIGLDLPDTRSWRLEPHAATSPPVAALLAWRKAERLATTYGWSWIDRNVGADGRLRGGWSAAQGAGRMTAQAGLHNLPAELRGAVRAEPGHVLVRADLGQVEPRVLAVVSGDQALAAAASRDDMYAPVADALRCDRPTAKVAVLAAMYGQTSGAAGAALRDMDRTYPQALAYLRAAEDAGRRGVDLRTYGGRLIRLARDPADDRYPVSSWGRFARNAVVQGAAAELFKAWAATVRAGLRDVGGQIVLCLHDELLLHVPQGSADAAAALLVSALDATAAWWAAGSPARFVTDVAIAETWAAAK
ncbi:MAG: DNA polymerase I [Frankiales bacterium]|nr:DNA polymerase I [Frankiales bacterium]